MTDTVLFLTSPVREALASIHGKADGRRPVYPVWRLLLTAVFATSAALTCAAVVILGAPGGGPSPDAAPTHIVIGPIAR